MKSDNGTGGTGREAEAAGAFPDDWDVRRYRDHAAFVPALGAPVVTLLAPRPGERILDLGCGDGTLTESLIAAGAEVVGIDASADMVAAARARGIDARTADAAALSFTAEFDAVFSNAALHWMTAADAVLAGVRRALRPGGRFVGEFGGAGNVAAIVTALTAVLAGRGVDFASISPWYFPTVDAYHGRLEAHGFGVDTIESIPRPTPLPGAMEDWLETLAAPAFRVLSERERAAARDKAVALLRPALCDERGRWTADYVRLRFAARLTTPPAGTENR
ncbi:MAG: methyltransferase domain-containing protein [Inquilinus sp.]|nr:methyltransferase domain-containing protein [Inquilinus sp.]